MTDAATLRKRRGVVRASITSLGNRLKDLEATPGATGVGDHAKQLATKLKSLDADFKVIHLQIVDLIEEEEALSREQDTLDGHDDRVSRLTVRLQQLMAKIPPSIPPSDAGKKAVGRKLARLDHLLTTL